ncbi:unnamed protein product [Urochloa decumbens]|uniref:Uncharacterized protein n=1 Tax=Urochloa decumbens TaxID=240449 RepID=A0ABC9CYL8_9POAL
MGAVTSSLDSEHTSTSPTMQAKSNLHLFEEIVGQEIPAHEGTTRADETLVRGTGIVLANRKKYWVDNENKNCFKILATDLSITWGDDTRYWKWEEESDAGTTIKVAKLLQVCWLDIFGYLEQWYLNPEVTYEVSFEVKLEKGASGWSEPVEVGVTSADGVPQKSSVYLPQVERGKWLQIKVGEVKSQPGRTGNVSVFLRKATPEWKKGLLIRGITITPKK